MRDPLEEALTLQAKLAELTGALAAEIARPASQRDNDALRRDWAEACRHRPKLASLFRKLRKIKAQQNAGPGLRQQDSHKQQLQETRLLGKRLKLWADVDVLINRHIDPNPVPLITDRDENISDPALTQIYQALHRLANPNTQAPDAADHGCFADIPMSIQSFELMIQAARRTLLALGRSSDLRFLDVGAGGGTKVFAASRTFDHCDGLEYDAGYAAAGAATLALISPDKPCRIHQGDGLTWTGYDQYDVIYFYRPLRDDDALAKLENHIISQARPGTVVIAPYNTFLDARKGFACAMVEEPLFITGMTQSEADRLRTEAERVGCEPPRRSQSFAFDTGFWEPLLSAASFRL